MSLLIAIPAFDEAATIGAIVASARTHGPVLVVDDGSTDDTGRRASAAGATVVRHERRRGKGAALATAVGAARALGATRVVTMDADGQHDPADLPAVLAASREALAAVIIGARHAAALSRGRALAIRVAGFWVNWITGEAISDTQSGFRVYPLDLFDTASLRGGRFVFETAVLVEAVARGRSIHEVPIRAVPYAARPSRFHPVGDGVAIASYLVGRALGRWGVEIVAGVREFGRVFTRERRTARHARMLGKVSGHAGTPAWGPAIGFAAADEIRDGLRTWWTHHRLRRARRVALATLASPVLLALVVLNAIARGSLAGPLERMVGAIYDQGALPTVVGNPGPSPVEEPSRWATVSR